MKFCALVLCLFALTACMAPAPQARIRISSGERVIMNLRDGTVEGFGSKLVKVTNARLMLSPQSKNGLYAVALQFAAGVEPTEIVVNDVTDEKLTLIMRDTAPALNQQVWAKTSDPVDLDHKSMAWMHDIDDSFRLYEMLVTLKDGSKIRLLHGALYLGFFKQSMMQAIKPDPNKP